MKRLVRTALILAMSIGVLVVGAARADAVQANDNFSQPQNLPGNSGTVFGNNVGATRQAGEPSGCVGSNSLWYTWKAPQTGTFTADTIGSSFDTAIDVYTGSSVSSLSRVTCNDDFYGLQSYVEFEAVAGTTYRIAITGYAGSTGDLQLSYFFTGRNRTVPAVASNGSLTLAVWSDVVNGESNIYGARINSAGGVLDPGGFVISSAADEQTLPTVTWTGSTFYVAWQDQRAPGAGTDIFGTRVTTNGGVVTPGGQSLASVSNQDEAVPSIASTSSGSLLLVWQNRLFSNGAFDIYGQRLTATGVKVGGRIAVSVAGGSQFTPSVASNGTDWRVVWQDRRNGVGGDIYQTRITSAGGVSPAAGAAVTTAPGEQRNGSIAWSGSNYFVAWRDRRASSYDIRGTVVANGGAVSTPSGTVISNAANDQTDPAVASNGGTFLVTWTDLRSGTSVDIRGSRVNLGGGVLNAPGIAISTAANDQSTSAVTAVGGSYFVAWGDTRSGTSSDIFGTRINSAGTVLNPGGIAIAT